MLSRTPLRRTVASRKLLGFGSGQAPLVSLVLGTKVLSVRGCSENRWRTETTRVHCISDERCTPT